MARVAFVDAIAELDNVAEDSDKDPILLRQCSVSDLSLVQMIAPEVEHESVLRVCVECVSLTFSLSTVPAHRHMLFALLLVLSQSALAQVFSKRGRPRCRITASIQLCMRSR